MNEQDRLLIFLNTQKMAGSSLTSLIKKQYPKDQTWFGNEPRLRELNQDMIQGLSCIGGHFNYGIHELFSKPYTYITMLSDPVDRVVSFYHYLKNRPSHGKHDRAKNMDFKAYLDEFRSKTADFQTRLITGGKPDLETAKKHLLQDFSFVGLTERFDESLFLIKNEFGWTKQIYKKQKFTKQQTDNIQLSEEITTLIKEHNQMDLELYHFATGLFEQRIQSLDASSRQDLEEYIAKIK